MSTGFDRAVALVPRHEGGYVKDPRDSGGETHYGISKRAYPHLDIQALTPAEASVLYRRDYWERCHCDDLPPDVALLVFDAAVNQGTSQAIRFLQEAACVRVDWVIGPVTLEGARQGGVAHRLAVLRALRYTRLPSFNIYGNGWLNRLFDVYGEAIKAG